MNLKWEQIKAGGIPPTPRTMHQATAYGDKIIVFGGDDRGIGESDRLFVFDTVREKWYTPPVTGPAAGERWGHSMVIYNNMLLSFGGYNGKYLTSQLLKIDIPPCKVFFITIGSG